MSLQDDAALPLDTDLSRRYLTLIAEVAARLLAAEDPAVMVDGLFTMIRAELRLDVFFNYRFEDGRLKLEAHGGLTEEEARAGAVLEIGQAVCGCAARDRAPLHATQVQGSADPMLAFVKQVGLDAYACTPLIHGGELLGTLGFGRRWADRFTHDELNFLHTVCHYVALAKYRLRMEARLREEVALREHLLVELNHRVRNALQLAVGLMMADARGSTEPGVHAALRLAADRLEVLALAHRTIYAGATPDAIDVGSLLHALIEQAGGDPALVEATGPAMSLPIEQAVALALLIHALIEDQIGDPPRLRLFAVQQESGNEMLCVDLSGTMRGQHDLAVTDGRIVRALSRQLRATVDQPREGLVTVSMPYVRHG
jgi:putative methionine-R-sulfoxide reductase with GAF domain